MWVDDNFLNELRDIKRIKSALDKKDYSDPDITKIMAKDPFFQSFKEHLTKNNGFVAQIKIQMDRKRGGF